MTVKEFKAQKPDFKGKLDVSAWWNTDQNGKDYLSVVLGNRVKLFQVEKEIIMKKIEDIYQ